MTFHLFPQTIMRDQILRDASGKEIGRIVKVKNILILKDAAGRELGRYDENSSITKDRNGKIVGRGNLLSHLIGLDQ
jgi:hypothetical protein